MLTTCLRRQEIGFCSLGVDFTTVFALRLSRSSVNFYVGSRGFRNFYFYLKHTTTLLVEIISRKKKQISAPYILLNYSIAHIFTYHVEMPSPLTVRFKFLKLTTGQKSLTHMLEHKLRRENFYSRVETKTNPNTKTKKLKRKNRTKTKETK